MNRASNDSSSVGSFARRGARSLVACALWFALGCSTTRRDVARVEAPIGAGTQSVVAAIPAAPVLQPSSAIAGPLVGAGVVAPVARPPGAAVFGHTRIPASAGVVAGTPYGSYPAPAVMASGFGATATAPQQPYCPPPVAMAPMPAYGIVPVGAFPTGGTGSSFVPAPGFAGPMPRGVAPAGPIGTGRVDPSSDGFRYQPRTAAGGVARTAGAPFLSGVNLSGLRLRPKRVPLGVYGPGGRTGMPTVSGAPLSRPPAEALDAGPQPDKEGFPKPSEQTRPSTDGGTGEESGPTGERPAEPKKEPPAVSQPDGSAERSDGDIPSPGKSPKVDD